MLTVWPKTLMRKRALARHHPPDTAFSRDASTLYAGMRWVSFSEEDGAPLPRPQALAYSALTEMRLGLVSSVLGISSLSTPSLAIASTLSVSRLRGSAIER